MAAVNNSALTPYPIFNQVWPTLNCPKSVMLDLDFQAAQQYDLDMLIQAQNGQFSGCQACYYDNQLNLANVNMSIPDTGFRSFFRLGWQGFRPLIFSQSKPIATFTCIGGTGIMRILLLNTPIQPLEWNAV